MDQADEAFGAFVGIQSISNKKGRLARMRPAVVLMIMVQMVNDHRVHFLETDLRHRVHLVNRHVELVRQHSAASRS